MSWTVRCSFVVCICAAAFLAGCRAVSIGEYKRLKEAEAAARESEERKRSLAERSAKLEEELSRAIEDAAILQKALEEAQRERPADGAKAPSRRRPDQRVETMGFSVEGRPLKMHVFEGEAPSLLVMGAIHGSEPAGAMVCDRLVEHLRENPPKRRTLVLPRANPDGLERGSRYNLRGVDLNRNFPADNFQSSPSGGQAPLSEPESRALHALILVERPGAVVSIHQPLAVIDYDGPRAEALARGLAQRMELPVRRLGTRPGSMGAWVGEKLGVPIVTLELPRHAERDGEEAVWRAYGSALAEPFLPDRNAPDMPLLEEAR